MFNPYGLEKLAKIEHTERLKGAARERMVRMAQDEAHQPAAGWRTIALSLAVLAVGLILLASIL